VSLSAFPYPGGKTPYWREIVSHFPQHRRYVEPFGGSAAVLLNKPESYIEVFNDLDEDVTHFFRVCRERRPELQEWLRTTPFSRSTHETWADEFFNGHRPDDDIERAGRWFSLRYMQYGAKLDRKSGFKASGKRNEARSFRGGIEGLNEVVARLQEVTIESEDYADVIGRYDGQEALFYLDPPYVGAGDYLYSTEFDHGRLVDALRDIEGYWICSYGEEIPDGMESIATTVTDFTAMYSLAHTKDKGRQEATETLAMNYDPDGTPLFSPAGQTTLTGSTQGPDHE
jgi:DNA adenine methylase